MDSIGWFLHVLLSDPHGSSRVQNQHFSLAITRHFEVGKTLMRHSFSRGCSGLGRAALVFSLALALGLLGAIPVSAQSLFRQLSQDSFSGGSGQHQSEVEPAAFAFGPTIVAAFQVSRVFGGGGMDVGFATSTNG